MTTQLRLPKSPEEQRAMAAARKARWRAKRKKTDAVNAAVDAGMGLGPAVRAPLPVGVDLAVLVRDRITAIVAGLEDADLMKNTYAPSITLGLKAQAQIEARERAKAKPTEGAMLAQVAMSLIELMGGRPAPLQLADPNVIEGDFDEVD